MDEDELELLRCMYPEGDPEINLTVAEGKVSRCGGKEVTLQLSVELKFLLVDVRVEIAEGTAGISLGRCRGLADSQAAALVSQLRSACRDADGEWCSVAIFGCAVEYLRDVQDNNKIECGICLHTMKPSRIFRAPCFHLFHKACTAAWYLRKKAADAQKKSNLEAQASSRQALKDVEGRVKSRKLAQQNLHEEKRRVSEAIDDLEYLFSSVDDPALWDEERAQGMTMKKATSKLRTLKSRMQTIAVEESKLAGKLSEAESELERARVAFDERVDAERCAVCSLPCPVCRQDISPDAMQTFLDGELKRLVTLEEVDLGVPQRWLKASSLSSSVDSLPPRLLKQVRKVQQEQKATREKMKHKSSVK